MYFLSGFFLLITALAFGETAPQSSLQLPGLGKFAGTADIRPSYALADRELRTETYLEAGYQWGSIGKLSLVHDFNLLHFNPSPGEPLYKPIDAYGRLQVAKIWTGFGNALDFSYEGRLYGPVDSTAGVSGFVTALRNYFKLNLTLPAGFSVMVMETPILILNRLAGYTSSKGVVKANPFFENRVFLIPQWNYKRLNVSLPIMLHATRHSYFIEDSENHDGWSYFGWVYPEITYKLDNTTSVGLAFYSDNLIQDGFEGLTTAGLAAGVPQLFVIASL